MTPPRIFTSVDALRGAHGDGSFATPRQTADLVASVEHHMARADAAEARIETAEAREERATLERDAAQRALANVVAERDTISADLHRVTMERDGARLSLDAAHEARIKQSLELAEARAEVVRLRERVEGLEAALRHYAPGCFYCGEPTKAQHIADEAGDALWLHACDGCREKASADAVVRGGSPETHELYYADVLRTLNAPAGGST